MLRDLPPFQPLPNVEVFMNAPGAEDEPTRHESSYVDPFDDVFGSAPVSPALNAQDDVNDIRHENESALPARSSDHPSDVSRLRSIHVTNGYREGIAASKEKHIQDGFDEGYSLGAEIALKAGSIMGSFEGLLHALPQEPSSPNVNAGSSADKIRVSRREVRAMMREAENSLTVDRLFGREYFGEDGVWVYDVPGRESEGNITFAKVAETHPVIQAWADRLNELCVRMGVLLETAGE